MEKKELLFNKLCNIRFSKILIGINYKIKNIYIFVIIVHANKLLDNQYLLLNKNLI